jgi:hypothetical protein
VVVVVVMGVMVVDGDIVEVVVVEVVVVALSELPQLAANSIAMMVMVRRLPEMWPMAESFT